MIRNSMYLSPNTRLIHKTSNRLTLITVFCFRVDPLSIVTSYETQELPPHGSVYVYSNYHIRYTRMLRIRIANINF
jgi:hypothetical protein